MIQKKKCNSCGKTFERLYQKNTCEACLVKSFQKLVTFIDKYRNVEPVTCSTQK